METRPALTVRPLRAHEARDFERITLDWLDERGLCGPRGARLDLAPEELALLRDPSGAVAPRGRVLAAARGDDVVGVCALRVCEDAGAPDESSTVELIKLGVDPRERGNGVGDALMRAAIACAHVIGARWIWLTSDSSLTSALALYRKHGFAVVRRGPGVGRRGDLELGRELAPSGLPESSLLEDASRRAERYIATIDERPVFPARADVDALVAFDEPLPETPSEPGAVLRALDVVGSPATVASSGGRYFGFVIGGALPVTVAASSLAAAWDQNAGLEVCSPTAARLEAVCERWLVELLGLPRGTAAGFVTGATDATFSGLAAGRHRLLQRAGWDVEAHGLYGAPPLRVVLGEQAHTTVYKALALLGLGRARVERVPVDSEGRMIAAELPPLDAMTLVIAQAGNVDSGAFDPLDLVAERARAAGAWLHIDGAFGLWAAASPRTAALCEGVGRADSWAVDGHKLLNVPYDSGVVLCRDRAALCAAMQVGAAYLPAPSASAGRDCYRYTPALSRRARGVALWAALKRLGREGVAALVERLCALTRRFADALSRRGLRVLNDVVFNQLLVAANDAATTVALLEHVQASGECWCGGTRWRGEPAIRLSVCSHASDEHDIDRAVRAFERALAEAQPQGQQQRREPVRHAV